MKKFVRQPLDNVIADPKVGLNDEQVKERDDKGYANVVHDKSEKTTAQIILGNTFTFFNSILFIIAGIFLFFTIFLSATGNDYVVNKYFGISKFVFLIPALMNVAMGTIQELHSRKIIRSLRIVTEAKTKVIRNGEAIDIDASKVVIDDIVSLSAGEQATADLEVMCGEVSVDESMLTGESDYIKKVVGDTILSGSAIITGEAKARAVKVGDDTYAAKLSKKVKSSGRHKSELMESILKIIKILTVAILVVTIVVVGTLIYKISVNGNDPEIWDGMTLSLDDPVSWARIIVTAGSFGVGIIPSGLVLTTSVALLLSIVSLSRKETLIQELYSLENLSRVDVICLDKTGTLTDGTMNVCEVKRFDHLEVIVDNIRNLNATVENRNQTAEALFKYFGAEENVKYKELIPFSSATKCSGLVYEDGTRILLGAPEYLLDKNDERLEFVREKAKEGKRVLAFMYAERLVAFFVIEDHIRDSAKTTLAFFKENNVDVKIISGDNPLTVSKIASMCGVDNSDKYISLEGVPLEDLDDLVEEYTIFARVSPEQKEALVAALQRKGHKVAMTGDGVNDILALRKADSSITFAKATEAAKSCSDVVLLDNDFSHLQDVVGEGRRVISNIQRTTILYLMKSIATIIFAFALIPFAKGQMWFTVENSYMLEATVVGTGGFLISLESKKTPIKGSFMKNIGAKSILAGILAAIAIVLPIAMYRAPEYLGQKAIIIDTDVRTMMTILMTISGFVVLFTMCIPFNKYRIGTIIATFFVASFLGFMLPTSFIGGQPTGPEMFSFDITKGQTIFDSQFFHELFQPWNSEVVTGLFDRTNNFILLRLFVFLAIPLYLVLMNYVDYKLANGENRKNSKRHTGLGLPNLMLLANGMGLAVEAFTELLQFSVIVPYLFMEEVRADPGTFWILFLVCVIYVANIFMFTCMAIFGYAVWKTGKRKFIITCFVFSIVAIVFMVAQSIWLGVSTFDDGTILGIVSNIAGILMTAGYTVASIWLMFFANRKKLISSGFRAESKTPNE